MSTPGTHAPIAEGHDEAPNEHLVTRRAALTGGLGALLMPVTGLLSPAAAAPTLADAAGIDELLANIPDICMVATETVEGPYYLDKSIVRSDIRDDQPGRRLDLELRIINSNAACRPVEGAVVSIWHCNAAGEYSGYLNYDPSEFPPIHLVDEKGHMPVQTPERFLRGAQVTDAEGRVSFTTIYPGWYTPRAIHIHVRVFLSEHTMMTTQLYFPQSLTDMILTTEENYKSRGASIYTNENDMARRQTGVSGQEDILEVTVAEDGTLKASRTLGASHA